MYLKKTPEERLQWLHRKIEGDSVANHKWWGNPKKMRWLAELTAKRGQFSVKNLDLLLMLPRYAILKWILEKPWQIMVIYAFVRNNSTHL